MSISMISGCHDGIEWRSEPAKETPAPEPSQEDQKNEMTCKNDNDCPQTQFCLKDRCVSSTGKNWIEYRWGKMPKETAIAGCATMTDKYVNCENGDDGATGDLATPFKTIQKAINEDFSCTRINVAAGICNVDVRFSQKNKIVLQGDDRKSVIDSGEKLAGPWTQLSKQKCGGQANCGIYKTTTTDLRYFLYANDQRVIPIRMKFLMSAENYKTALSNDQLADTPQAKSNRLKKGIDMLLKGPRVFSLAANGQSYSEDPREWTNFYAAYFIEAAAKGMEYDASKLGQTIYLRILDKTKFDGIDDPNRLVMVQPKHTGVHVSNSSNIVIRGFTVKHGQITVKGDSHRCTVEGNSILSGGKRAVYIYGTNITPLEYPSDVTVRYNYIAPNYAFGKIYEDNSDTMFHLIKAGNNDEHGVAILSAKDKIEVHHNYLFGAMNGIQDMVHKSWKDKGRRIALDYTDAEIKELNKGIDVHHNIVENSHDDCLEPTSAGLDAKWHDNLLLDCADGLRTKMHSDIATGPFYIYRNVFLNRDNWHVFEGRHTKNDEHNSPAHDRDSYSESPTNMFNIFFFSGHNAKLYIFNNVFIGYRGLGYGSTTANLLAPKTYFLNNIFSNKYSIAQWSIALANSPDDVSDDDYAKKKILMDYNLIGGKYAAHVHQEGGQHSPRYHALPPDMIEKYYRQGKNNLDLRVEGQDLRPWHNNPDTLLDIGDFCVPRGFAESVGAGINLAIENRVVSTTYSYSVVNKEGKLTLIDDKVTIAPFPREVIGNEGSGYMGAFKPEDESLCKGLGWLR
jgi:hypothetical protein